MNRQKERRKHTMKRLTLIPLLFATVAFGQAVRVDIPLQTYGPNVPTSGGPQPQALWIANATITLCSHPSATLGACQGAPITTYTDASLGTACPTNKQLVQLPGTTCEAKAGTAGNIGFWYAGGLIDYWIQGPYGTYGPFSITGGGGGGGGGSPFPPSFSVQAANSPATGFVSDPSIKINTATHNLAALSLQDELNGALFASPEAAAAAACAAGKAVYFPAGTYATNGIPVCSNLHIRCASSDITTAQGTIFNVNGANWGLYNPNADAVSGGPAANQVRNVRVEGCGFNIANNPSALGGWRIKGILWSYFEGNTIYTNNNSGPAIAEDGGNYQQNGGDYDNTFVGNNLYDNSTTSSGIGYLLTGSGGSNNNTHTAGSVARFGTAVDIENGNNNSFIGIDGENWYHTGLLLTAGASGNLFQRFRLEENLSPWSGPVAKTLGQSIVDSNGNRETITTAGTTGSVAPVWNASNVNAILKANGCAVTGTPGQTVLLNAFNNGSTATATGTLVATNTISGATWVVTSVGTGATAAPTSATCSAGTVSSASGTATLVTSVGTVGNTTSDGSAVWTLSVVMPTDVMATGSTGNTIDVYISGYEMGVLDSYTQNNYPRQALFGCTACGNSQNATLQSSRSQQVNVGVNKTPNLADGYALGGLDVNGEIQSNRYYLLCNSSTGCETINGGGYARFSYTGATTTLLTLPVVNGQLLGTNATIPLVATGLAGPGVSYPSNLLQFFGSYDTGGITSAFYTSGLSPVGSAGQTCLLSNFDGGGSGATGTLTLTGTNAISSGSAITMTANGSGYTSLPTTATVTTGTASSCSGTILLSGFTAGSDFYTIKNSVNNTGVNSGTALVINPSGSPGTHTFETVNMNLLNFNNTSATSLANAPGFSYTNIGHAWNGTSSAQDSWVVGPSLAAGSNPLSTWAFTHSGPGGGSVSVPNLVDTGLTAGTAPVCPNGPNGTLTTSGCTATTGTGLSGMTAGQVPIAASAASVTSSIPLGNSGSDIPQLSSGLLNPSVIPNNTANAGGLAGGILGTVWYQSAPDTTAGIAPNSTTSILCLTQQGDGVNSAAPVWGACAGSTAVAFSAITGSTNTSATMLVGTGASLGPTGTGTVNANQVNGASVPTSKTIVGTNSSGQIIDASSATLTNNTSGNAATATVATALASSPTNCTASQAPTGINASGTAQNCTTYVQTICSGTIVLSTSAIPLGSTFDNTAACSGLLSSDNIQIDFASNPTAVTGYGVSGNTLTIYKYPTANTIHVVQGNNSNNSGTITPGVMTLNFHAFR